MAALMRIQGKYSQNFKYSLVSFGCLSATFFYYLKKSSAIYCLIKGGMDIDTPIYYPASHVELLKQLANHPMHI
jgi:hypothetical protein